MNVRKIGRVGLTAGVLAAVFGLSQASLSSAALRPLPAKRLVAYPRAGKRVPARPLLLRVRARRRARVGAKLNGRSIARYLSRPSRRGLRRLRASPTYGLRHGRNVLWVRVRPPGAKRARVQRVRFRVAGDRPLAAAGLDRRVAQHARFSLDGRRSLSRPGARGRKLRYRWTLLRAPRDSRLWRRTQRGERRARSRAPLTRELGAPPKPPRRRAVRPRLRLDHPGVYRFKLTVVGPDGKRGSDQVSLRVDPPPLVSVDTMAKPPKSKFWGVRVGTEFYSDPGKNSQWLQVVVLDSSTQERILNKSYSCPQATANPHADSFLAVKACTEEVRSDIVKLGKGNAIVIAVSQPASGKMERTKPWQTQPPVGFWTALDGAGGDALDQDHANPQTPLLRGRISAIARTVANATVIPFGPPVVAHDPFDLDRIAPGEITGFLVRDNVGTYSAFRSPEQPPYETQAEGSAPLANVIRIGSNRYHSETNNAYTHLVSGEGGFQVVMADPSTLEGDSEMFGTRLNECSPCAIEVGKMKEWIEAQAKQGHTLLFLASIGDTRLRSSDLNTQGEREAENGAAAGLIALLAEKFGATFNRVHRALSDAGATPAGPRSYSLIARYGTPAGRGLEREGPMGESNFNGVPQSGSLAREGAYEFEPEAGLASGKLGNAGAKLREVAFSQPGNWPEQGNPGRSRAIGWIGDQVGIDSHRSLFWTQPYTVEFWTAKKEEIAELAKPKLLGFDQADFEWAKAELELEIRWLESVHGFASNLARPFAKGELSAWADVEVVASKIQELVNAPPGPTRSELELTQVYNFGRELTEAVPLVGSLVKAVEATYNAVAGMVEIADGTEDAEGHFRVAVGELGKKLAERFEVTQKAIEDQLVDVVVADYNKLRTVGLCASLSKACPDGPPEQWQFTQVEQEKAAPAVDVGTRTLIYTALLPTRYEAWLLPSSSNTATSRDQGHQVAGQTSTGYWCAFYGLPLTAQLAYPTAPNVEDVPGVADAWRVVAYAHRFTKKGRYWMDSPASAVTDPLFEATAQGGLGANPEVFYRRGWGGNAQNFENYPEANSRPWWVTKDDPFGLKNECGW
jgi:hypothetical protein